MNRDKSILGIHIDDGFLSIVALQQTANGLQIDGWTNEPLEQGTVKDGLIIHRHIVSQKIQDFLKAKELKTRKAIMSPSCAAIRLTASQVSERTGQQMQKQVEEQIEKYSLFGSQEIVFDYCTFENVAQTIDKQTILKAVTTREVSDACLDVARQARLDLVRIEPAVLPITRLIYDKQSAVSDGVSILLALEAASGNICVFKDTLPHFCRNLSVGIKDISQEEQTGFASLAEQMKPVLEFARSLAGSQQLVLRVAAGCSTQKTEAIVGRIRHNFSDMTVEQVNSSQLAEQFDVRAADTDDLPIFALTSALTALGVCGSAEPLNLVSQESLVRQKTQSQISLTAKAVVVAVLLSVAAIVPLKMKVKGVEATLSAIQAGNAKIVHFKQKLADLNNQTEQLKKKQSAYAAADRELIDIPWPQILHSIGSTMPNTVRIVSISTTEPANFTLIGEALAENYVYRFAKNLQASELITTAKVQELEYDSSGVRIVVDYRIVGKIRLPKSSL